MRVKKDFLIFAIITLCLVPFIKGGIEKISPVFATAIRESGSTDATPMSLYGNYNGAVKKIAVDSNGYILANVEVQ